MQLELHEEVGEGNNKRIWKFKGLVLKVKKASHVDGTFTIRGKTAGHTIEKIYPLSFLKFAKVLLLDEYKIRRAKLYYMRDKVGKSARMTSTLTKDEKNIDLMALAVAEAEAIKAAYEEKHTPTVEEVTEEVDASEETTNASVAETVQEDASVQETQQEEAQETEEQAQD